LAENTRKLLDPEWRDELLDALTSRIALVDGSGFVLEANAAWQRHEKVAVGASLLDSVGDEGEGYALAEAVRAVLRGDRGEVAIEYASGKDDARRWLSARVTRLERSDPARLLVVQDDVTARRREQAELTRTMQMDRMVAVSTLAAGLGHELKNPLAYVTANLEFLGEELATLVPPDRYEEIREVLGEMRHGTDRIHKVARDVLTFADLKQEVVQRVDVTEVIDSTLGLVANALRHRATLVRNDASGAYVNASPSRLGQVFYNLLLNAVQAIPDGSAAENEIAITTLLESGHVVVEIRDTGSGIAREHLPRVFDPFFTTRDVGHGSGLGLAISQTIVRQLGGEIEIHSEEGCGTTVRVVLPSAARKAASTSAPPGPRSGIRARVLLVDDEPAFGAAVRRMLADSHDVVFAASGREALAILAENQSFDVVLCDLMMPGMTGMDVHAAVEKDFPDLARKMIFMTGGAFSQRAREFLHELDGPILEKPCDTRRLKAAISQVLRQERERLKIQG
jgi:signal transduction histidine kinase/ActR/RegA family two-component response regulator